MQLLRNNKHIPRLFFKSECSHYKAVSTTWESGENLFIKFLTRSVLAGSLFAWQVSGSEDFFLPVTAEASWGKHPASISTEKFGSRVEGCAHDALCIAGQEVLLKKWVPDLITARERLSEDSSTAQHSAWIHSCLHTRKKKKKKNWRKCCLNFPTKYSFCAWESVCGTSASLDEQYKCKSAFLTRTQKERIKIIMYTSLSMWQRFVLQSSLEMNSKVPWGPLACAVVFFPQRWLANRQLWMGSSMRLYRGWGRGWVPL